MPHRHPRLHVVKTKQNKTTTNKNKQTQMTFSEREVKIEISQFQFMPQTRNTDTHAFSWDSMGSYITVRLPASISPLITTSDMHLELGSKKTRRRRGGGGGGRERKERKKERKREEVFDFHTVETVPKQTKPVVLFV